MDIIDRKFYVYKFTIMDTGTISFLMQFKYIFGASRTDVFRISFGVLDDQELFIFIPPCISEFKF